MNLYALSFNDDFASRDRITAHLDTRRDLVGDWYYCLTNTIFIASPVTVHFLNDFLLSLSRTGRFFLSPVGKYNHQGWLPKDAWDFINKYAQ